MNRSHLTATERVVCDTLLAGREADAKTITGRDRPEIGGALLASVLTGEDRRWIRLRGFAITGGLDLSGVSAVSALTLTDCEFDILRLTAGEARTIWLDDCRFDRLELDGAVVHGSLRVTRSHCRGWINLLQAKIEGNVNLDATQIRGREEVAIVGDRIRVEHTMFLRSGFFANGAIRLLEARIGGQLNCDGARLRELNLDSAAVGGALLLRSRDRQPFAAGEIRLTAARVGGPLECGGTLTAEVALRANGMVAESDVELKPDLMVKGEVKVRGARIERDFTCRARSLSNPDGAALDLSRTTIKGTLTFAPGTTTGCVKLLDTSVGRLEDIPDRWPPERHFNGLTYGSIGVCEGKEPPARDRIAWLPDPYAPQPYEALAATYRTSGDEQGARLVGISKQRHRNRKLPRWRRPWGVLLDATVGYGYLPARALAWMAGLVCVGTVIFTSLYGSGALEARGGAGPKPAFSPVLYSLDLLLPVVNLRQRDAWVAVELHAQVAQATFIVLGWIIATAAVAALTGLLRRA